METNDLEKRMLYKVNLILGNNGITDPDIANMIVEEATTWNSEIIDELDTMIREWEQRMGKDDKTMYTLGIRRVKDLLGGKSIEEPTS
jgi:hypothetical protein